MKFTRDRNLDPLKTPEAMKKNNDNKSEAAILRLKAEKLLKKSSSEMVSKPPEADNLKLIHELQVHQIELEMQNEELLKAKKLAEAATLKATTLYDFAPSGYFTLACDGEIIELNLAGAKILGKERHYLKNKRFGLFITSDAKPAFSHFLDKVFESKSKQSCEITVSSNNSKPTYVYLTGTVIENSEYCWLTVDNITELRQVEEALQENNSRLNLAMEAANMAWWGMEISTGSVTFGKRKAEMLGYPPKMFKQYKDFTELLHPDDHDKTMKAMHEHINGHTERYEAEYRILTRSGEYKWFYDIGSVVNRNSLGVPLNVTGLVFDITERKLAEAKLTESEKRYSSLYDSIDEGFCIIELIFDENEKPVDFLFLDVNPAFEKQTGLIGAIGRKIQELAPLQEEYWFEIYGKVALTGQPIRFTNRAAQFHRWYDVYAFRIGPPETRQVAVLFNDITIRIEADLEIKKSKEQLTQLYKHLNDVREEERTSIAREIHDDLGQSLAGLKLDLIGMKEEFKDKAGSKQKIDKAISLVDTTIKTVQKLSSQLRPQMLDELGLAASIEWQSNEFRKRTGIKCKLELEEIDDLPENISISLFRIFQASLTNIMLHSKAKSISVKLEVKEETIQLTIIDDGRGITAEQLNSAKSFGIIGMRERANQINGRFEIHTKVKSGTEIIVSVPLK